MRIKKFLKDEKGATLPFVTIILGLFALGFIALVVDVGILYVQRKAMITSADAAALAGAQALRDSQGVNVSEAETIAKNYAIANGADPSQVEVSVSNKSVIIPNGTSETRQVVDVTVGKNQPLIFARFLDDKNPDVKAYAIATWGYVKKSDFCPIFIFNTGYKLETDITLHDNVTLDNENDLKTNGYGFIQIGPGEGMNDIKKAIEGTIDVEPKSVGDILSGAPGKRESVYNSIMTRIGDTVIIPIIDWKAFSERSDNKDKEGNIIENVQDWNLPIMFFAYFTITDVIKQNEKGIESVQIIGHFTGETVDEIPVIESGDQSNPNPDGDTPATYFKLIK